MKIIVLGIVQRKDNIMTLQEILDRIKDVIDNDNVDELNLLRHDLENDIISENEELESLVDNNPDDGSWVGR
jgi:hypothetical protein